MKRQVIAMVGVAGLVGATVVAQPRPARQGPRTGADPARLEEALGLDPGQVQQLRQLRGEQQKAAIRQRADLEVARLELQELLSAETVDERAVAAKTDALAKLQTAALRARIDSRLALRKVLTAEQARKLEQLRRHAPRGMRERRPHRRVGPGGPFGGGMPDAPEDEDDIDDGEAGER